MGDDQFQLNWWDSSRNRFDNTEASTDKKTSQASSINNNTAASSVATNYGWSSTSDSLTVSSSGVDLHMMGLGLSRTNQNLDWSRNQGLLGEKSEGSFIRQLIQDDNRLSSSPSSPFSGGPSSRDQHDHHHHSKINIGFSMDHHRQQANSNDNTITSSSQNLNVVNSFQQVDSAAAYGMLLSENHHHHLRQQQQDTSPYDHQYGNNQSTSNDPLMASWNKHQNFLRPNQQLHVANNAPFWDATATVNNDPRLSFFSTRNMIPVGPSYDEKPKAASDVTAATKNSTAESSLNKRPRNESPSPAFKVRKEKMGDRITALQQLVSPFGKTDTASVLSEAIQYIKFLHEQISVLSSPYMKNGNPPQNHQISYKSKDQEGPRQDLRSRGLCLIPVSSTFPMTHETTVDFWTPTFGGTFR